MQIEAKFNLAEPGVYWHLQMIERLADFSLSTRQVQHVRDTYLDTRGRRLFAAGYSCRLREQREAMLLTLKSLSQAADAVHRREEWEMMLTANQPPARWPHGPVRTRVLELIGSERLLPLFDLHQTRVIRTLRQNQQPVAELSLDRVSLTTKARKEHVFLELEVELISPAPEERLAAIIACLQHEWQLNPETQSKFERALTVVEEKDLKIHLN